MDSVYLKTGTPGLKPGVFVLRCAEHTLRPFRAGFARETANPYVLSVRTFRSPHGRCLMHHRSG